LFLDDVLATLQSQEFNEDAPTFDCPECGGSGWLPPANAHRFAMPCSCVKAKTIVKLARASGVPLVLLREMKFAGMKMPDEEYRSTLTQVRGWLESFEPGKTQKGFLLHGRAGSGKTRVLISGLRYLIVKKQVTCRYFDARSFLQLVRSTYGDNPEVTESQVIESFVSPEVVALDELTIPRTPWEQEMTLQLISERYKLRKVLLVATNISPEQLADELDERIVSRLKSMCVSVKLSPISGQDFRSQAIGK
jgi:DNA replication protein DnaC